MNFIATITLWLINFAAIVISLYYIVNTLDFVTFKCRILPTIVLNISTLPLSIILSFTAYFNEEFLFNHKNGIVYIIGTFSKYYYLTYITFYLLSILFLITIFTNFNSKTTNELINILAFTFIFTITSFTYIIFGLLGYHPLKLYGNFSFLMYSNNLLNEVIFWVNFTFVCFLTFFFTAVLFYMTIKGFKVQGHSLTRNISYLLALSITTLSLLLFDSITIYPTFHSVPFIKTIIYTMMILPTLYSLAYIIIDRKTLKETDVTINKLYNLGLIKEDFCAFLKEKEDNKTFNSFLKWEDYREELLLNHTNKECTENEVVDSILDNMCELEKNFIDRFEYFKTTEEFTNALHDYNKAGALDNELNNARSIFSTKRKEINSISF